MKSLKRFDPKAVTEEDIDNEYGIGSLWAAVMKNYCRKYWVNFENMSEEVEA